MERLRSMWLLCSGKETAIQAGARVVEEMARSHESSVTLFAAVEGADDDLARSPLGRQLKQLIHDNKEQQLRTLVHQLEAQLGEQRARPMLVDAPSTWHALTTHAIDECPELVIVPAEAEGRSAFGSTSQHLFRKCPSPVWALTPETGTKPKRVLVAVDPGAPDGDNRRLSKAIMSFALRFCAPLGAQIHLVHAWRVWGETLSSPRMSRATIAEYVEQERQSSRTLVEELMVEASAGGKVAEQHFIKGDPEVVVPRLAKTIDADVVILGSAARTGLRGFFMGSVAESILNRLDCSAIVVKHPSFVSPVARR